MTDREMSLINGMETFRFIILELLAGGDLKTFLRESRPKPVGFNYTDQQDLGV